VRCDLEGREPATTRPRAIHDLTGHTDTSPQFNGRKRIGTANFEHFLRAVLDATLRRQGRETDPANLRWVRIRSRETLEEGIQGLIPFSNLDVEMGRPRSCVTGPAEKLSPVNRKSLAEVEIRLVLALGLLMFLQQDLDSRREAQQVRVDSHQTRLGLEIERTPVAVGGCSQPDNLPVIHRPDGDTDSLARAEVQSGVEMPTAALPEGGCQDTRTLQGP
jgi:hypothetical protein